MSDFIKMDDFKGFQGTNSRLNNKTLTEELERIKGKFLNDIISNIMLISEDLSNDNFKDLSDESKMVLAKSINNNIKMIDDGIDSMITHVRIEEINAYKTEIGEIK